MTDAEPAASPWSTPRRRVVVGCVLAIIAVAGVVAGVLISVTGSSPPRPNSPTATAQDWIDAHLHHDSAEVRRLSCAGDDNRLGLFDITYGANGVTAAKARPAQPLAAGTWNVVLDVSGPSGPVGTYPVTVRRSDGGYLVC